MKVLALLLISAFASFSCFAQEGASLDSKFNPSTINNVQQSKIDHAMLIMDDDIMMDKLFTSIRSELIYNGSDNNIVHFKHNEYLSDLNGFFTKPGYSRNLDYNLEKSNIIDYKGLRIEIISANSDEINYRILSGSEDQDLVISKLVRP